LAHSLLNEHRYNEAQDVIQAFKDQRFYDFDLKQQGQVKPIAQTPHESDFQMLYEQATNSVGVINGQLALLKQKQRSQELTGEEEEQLKKLNAQLEVASGGIAAFLDRAEREFATPDDKDRIGEVVGVKSYRRS